LGWVEASRGFAATAVVIYHVVRHFNKNYGLPILEHVVQFGHAGVDLFFVLSGFIILFVHYDDIGKPDRIKRYFERRLTRILPAYWVAVTLTIAMVLAGGHLVSLKDVALAILPIPISSEPIVGVAWTLQYEFVFYAMFAVLIFNRRVGIALMLGWLTVIVVSAVWTITLPVPEALYGLFSVEFFAGMAVAYRLRQGSLSNYKIALAAGMVLFAGFAVVEDLGWMDGYGLFARVAYGGACALVILGAAEASRAGFGSVPLILKTLGSASYSLYLFQFVFIGLAWKIWQSVRLDTMFSPLIGCLLFSVVTVVGGIAGSRLVEYPLMGRVRVMIDGPRIRKASVASPKVTAP
jgi:peptidoglycan/LPS O-acetylase OafA/YrhL